MRVSIVIDNYNYQHYVGQAIESALAQTHNDLQVIEAFNERITTCFKANGGQASAFNAGLTLADGEVVFFLDADDLLLPEAAATVAAMMGHEPNIASVTWRMPIIDSDGRRVGGFEPSHELDHGMLRQRVIEHGPLYVRSAPTSGNAFRRSALDRPMPKILMG